MQARGHEGPASGLNAQKQILFGRYDIAAGKFYEIEVPQQGRLAPRPAVTVNLPVVGVGPLGNPWLACAITSRPVGGLPSRATAPLPGAWSQPMEIPQSTFCQDRHATLARRRGDVAVLAQRSAHNQGNAPRGRVLAQLKGDWLPYQAPSVKVTAARQLPPYMNPPTPSRPAEEHHTWVIGGKKYKLLFGDLHRHTDFSNCITPFDTCTLEHFRYACDVAGLDFMGTSDHTDVGIKYDPYEWWQTQRTVDVFYVPGRFNSLYAYEREQPYPWGHRNVVFAQRGAPIVYINRKTYQASPWHSQFPVGDGGPQITPMELWRVLVQYGRPVAVISHTGATGMGTDWDKYERIDGRVENTVEVFQGARVSYEGLGTPQPTVGLRVGDPYNAAAESEAVIPTPPAPINDFGKQRNNGVYQHALADGFKLGAFASSDHILDAYLVRRRVCRGNEPAGHHRRFAGPPQHRCHGQDLRRAELQRPSNGRGV